MEFKEKTFIPVLLGGDINTYSVARAFYEQYQVKSCLWKVSDRTQLQQPDHSL